MVSKVRRVRESLCLVADEEEEKEDEREMGDGEVEVREKGKGRKGSYSFILLPGTKAIAFSRL